MTTSGRKPKSKIELPSDAVRVPFAPMIDLLSTIRDHGKLGELRAQMRTGDLKMVLSGQHLAALRSFVSSDPFMSQHPVGRNFLDAPVGEDCDLGFCPWG